MELLILLLLFAFTGYLLYLSSDNKLFISERIASLFFSFGFLFLLISVASYLPESEITNWGGKLGYIIASILVTKIGYLLSALISLIFSIYGFMVFLNRAKKEFLLELLAIFVILFIISLYLPIPLSGNLSVRVSTFLLNNLGIAGKIIVSILFIIMSSFIINVPRLLKKRKKEKEEIKRESNKEKEPPKTEPKVKETLTQTSSKYQKPLPTADEEEIDPHTLINLLKPAEPFDATDSKQELEKNKTLIEEKLREFNIEGKVVNYYPGPVVTRYEYEPAPGIRLSKISSLADDIALRMRSNAIRIIAPLPNKGLVGFEIPNKNRKTVYLRALVERAEFFNLETPLAFALGVDTAGNPVYADLSNMPHLLIAGSTGSGKSVCINTIITSIIFRNKPEQVRFVLIDPKRIELSLYEGIPHLLLPVVKDRKLAVEVLKKAVKWMDYRYKLFAKETARDISSYNEKMVKSGGEPIPYLVIIIDEFADLIITTGREIEEPLARLAQMARAVGIHLIVATQRPSVDVITGMIKANFPVRIAFKVPSRVDSKTILDDGGAEKLLGRGDMIFIPPGTSEKVRIHGPLITEEETKKISRTLTHHYLIRTIKSYFGLEAQKAVELVEELMDENLYLPFIRVDEPGLKELEEKTTELLCEYLELEPQIVKEKMNEIRNNYYRKIPEMTEIPLAETEEEIGVEEGEWDPMLEEAARAVILEGKASATLLQRRLKLGFARAARVIDQLEQLGIIGPQEGTKPRKVLIKLEDLERIFKKERN
ncbi:MAG: DNA translocase FtsK [bacterium]|nr:DNA translocase FtsK [bacterium]